MKKIDVEQRSDEWFHLRKGKVTGTTLKAIMGTPKARQDALYEVIAERLMVGIPDEMENAMDRGLRLEEDAISTFELETGKSVERMGLVVREENENIAYSPDGLIGEDEDIEVKCMGGKNHVKLWLTDKVSDEYAWQVVQAFVVNEKLQKRNFVGYNPDITIHPLHIIEVLREEIAAEIAQAKKAQEAFLQEVESILETLIKL